jgi:hypothetical protein
VTPEQAQDLDYLLSPRAIRDQARAVLKRAEGGGTHFAYLPEKLDTTVEYVLDVIRRNYPTLEIPFHSRWGHFRVGGMDRVATLRQRIAGLDPLEQARVQLDLVIPSVLLDAGAGDTWKYREAASGQTFARSEGLGVASLDLFLSGAFAADGKSPRSDAEGLRRVTAPVIARAFQAGPENPLVGVEGRAGLLRSLGDAVADEKRFPGRRPGGILDFLMQRHGREIPATALLRAVLDGLGSIWPGRLQVKGQNLGDVWRHSELGLVPFHKLSQWMTYSLIEPIEAAGVRVTGVEQLTGLAEYRNGGLMLDSGLIELRDPRLADRAWTPDHDLIIEWRALTVALLDGIGERVQRALGRSAAEFPLAKVLEGGTWWAGRFLAREKRTGGGPPLRLESDGTVF